MRASRCMSSVGCALFLLFASFAITTSGSARAEAERIVDQPELIASPEVNHAMALQESFDSPQGIAGSIGGNLSTETPEQVLQFLRSNGTLWDGRNMLTIDRLVDDAVFDDSGKITIALGSPDESPTMCRLLVPLEDLKTGMPDLAILDREFHLQVVDGVSYVATDLTSSSATTNLTFSSFIPAKGDRWFTFGSEASVRLLGHPMFVSILCVPDDVRTQIVQPDPINGSEPVEVSVRANQLEILFDGSDCSGQLVSFNQCWLESLGIGTPVFLTESGEALRSEYQCPQYVVEVPHFSAVVVRGDFNSIADGFVFTQGGGSSFMSNYINARDGLRTLSPKRSIHQGYTGGSPDGTDSGVVSATKTYSLSRIESIGAWFYISYFSHDWNWWDYLKGGIRLNLKDSQGTVITKYEYWLFSWHWYEDHMDPSDPAHEKRIYDDRPPTGIWVKFFGVPDTDWPDIPWDSAASIAVELFVHGSGTCGDHFEVHFDDLMVSADTSCITYVFKGATEVGQDSQSFFFKVPSPSIYVAASVSYNKADTDPSHVCDVDGSFWDVAGLRTGGYTSQDQSAKTQIPNSAHSLLTLNPEYMYVTSVSSSSVGLWKASVYCRSTSMVGATFEVRIDVYLDHLLPDWGESQRFSFSAPSNSYEIRGQLDHESGNYIDFDLSIWDSIGRRTGGWTSSEHESSYEIYNSIYSGYSANPEWIDVIPGRTDGSLWQIGCFACGLGGYYHLTVVVETDFDCDGVRNSLDIDPAHDLCVRLKVTQLTTKDNMESGNWDPYVRFAIGTSIPDKTVIGSDAWQANNFSRSKEPLRSNGNYNGEYVMWKNVPDDSATAPLLIQAWDDDGLSDTEMGNDEIADISGQPGGADENHQDGSTLHLTYNLLSQTWSGDDGGDGVASGEDDGSYGSSGGNNQADAEIRFSVTTTYELPYTDKFALSEKFSPRMYFDATETYHPIEVGAMLDQSDLKLKSDDSTVAQHPLLESSLSAYRTTSYMDQVSKNQVGYQNLIYSHVSTSDNDAVVIQYWFFYVFNDVSGNQHEGDWEMIQLVFPDNSRYDPQGVGYITPTYGVYSQHYFAYKKTWSNLPKDGNHPKVFVEKGSHASMFSGGGIMWRYPDNFGIAITSSGPWVNFAGKWGNDIGQSGLSPHGPVYRVASDLKCDPRMWHEPIFFLARART